jgi:amino acid adenylation domain-containing protein
MEVAVVGMAGRFPGASGIAEFWENLKNGVEAISFFSEEELLESGVDPALLAHPNYVKAKGVLEGVEYFDALFFDYTPKDVEIMDPQLRVLHECVWNALEDGGYAPGTHGGPVGLYAAAATSLLWTAYAMVSADSPSQQFAVRAFNENYSFSTRVSYTLDLKGPALTLHTACSSSLMAIHLACQGLLSGECDMAVAGGVLISYPLKNGYVYQEGLIRSPDGHCRAFDARAEGTVAGDGAGAVSLKRLQDARRDGDFIYAVIRDSASNNDGRRKVGYTAPSIDGQVEVLRTAHERAEVEPGSIGYVETHGTGTRLGDPLEIKALKLAFKSNKTHFCALGAVKSNVGHLDAAAGVTGFIKTVLTLKHRMIPPSLHFTCSNREIEFGDSPFYINTGLSPFKEERFPLRAGVSAFGIGGTNVHIVLQEAPPLVESSSSRDYQLILLSARTESCLQAVTDDFVSYLRDHPGTSLPDIAFTLQVGKRYFKYRKMVVCRDAEEAAHKLSSLDNRDFQVSLVDESVRPVVFMFPGQASQYVNMGLELYRKEPVFRRELDGCFDILASLTGVNIRNILYPVEGGSETIDRTDISQALVFSFEYALAQLLISWGIRPSAMIGYSFGEYVAACLAGVFSLEDALLLVSLRGQLMQGLPAGVMLSVPLTEEQLLPLLEPEPEISLAIVNGPSCIVSGPESAISGFEKKMKERRYMCMRIKISVACHSKELDGIVDRFREKVASLQLNEPQIPFISCITGKPLRAAEAADAEYWAGHLRGTVRFVAGIESLARKQEVIFIEVGPGIDLSSLVRRHIGEDSGHDVINLVRHAQKNGSDLQFLLNRLGRLWLYGKTADWVGFYGEERRFRVPLPTYPFDWRHFPVRGFKGDPFKLGAEAIGKKPSVAKRGDISKWFYLPSWKRSMPPVLTRGVESGPSYVLIFADESGIGEGLASRLRTGLRQVMVVRQGEVFSRQGSFEYTLNPGNPDEYETLMSDLERRGKLPGAILHLWSLSSNPDTDMNINTDAVTAARVLGLDSLMSIVGAMGALSFDSELKLVVVTDFLWEVTGAEPLLPEKAPLMAAVRVIPQEYPYILCRCIDVRAPEPGDPAMEMLQDRLESELFLKSSDPVAAYRDHYRWIQVYEPVVLGEAPAEADVFPRLRRGGVYLITGGLGNIGLILSRYLAEAFKAKLILTRRSRFPARGEWEPWLESHDVSDPVSLKIKHLKEIEALGGEVIIAGVDVSDREGMAGVIRDAEARFGAINGLIHAAGVMQGDSFSTINYLDPSHYDEQFQPKVKGTLVLDELLSDRELDFYLLVSSLSPILGGLGLAAYASANLFMDAFVYKKNRETGGNWISLNWGDWEVSHDIELERPIGAELLKLVMTPLEGIETFRRVLYHCRTSQMIVSSGDLQARIDQWIKLESLRQQVENVESKSPGLRRESQVSGAYAAPGSALEKKLVGLWEQLLGFDRIGVEDDFFELGGDSLKAITLAARLHKELGVKVLLEDIFREPNIRGMAALFEPTRREGYQVIQPVEQREYYPLSSAQKRLYILQRMEPGNTAYNEFVVLRMTGPLDRKLLEKTFVRLIERHECFRTSICLVGDEPVQVIHDRAPFQVEEIKGGGNDVQEIISGFVRPFDLLRPPLMRVGLSAFSAVDHLLIMEMHHSVTDGVSIGILLGDFSAMYSGKQLAVPLLQYKDYAVWQQALSGTAAMARQEEYWLGMFSGEIPVLDLPFDFPRPLERDFEGRRFFFQLNKEETAAVKELVKTGEATLFMVLLAVYTVFLSRLSGSVDIVVGVPTAGRGHAQLESIIGMFVNTLALRNAPSAEKTFISFLSEVKEQTLSAFENQDYQYEELVERLAPQFDRSAGHNPLFDVVMVVQNIEVREKSIRDLTFKPYASDKLVAKFDLTLQGYEVEGILHFFFEYSTALFKRDTIEGFSNRFKQVLAQVTARPDRRLADIEIITEEEKDRIVNRFNDTTADYPRDKALHQLVEDQAHRTPDGIAITGPSLGENRSYRSYRSNISHKELDRRSHHLACRLKEKGVVPGNIVAIKMKRSIDMIVSILGILKAGAAYLPIDPEYPRDRIDYMLRDSAADLVLEDSAAPPNNEPAGVFPPRSLAYIIYTSGTTGKPKGAAVEHRSVVNMLTFRKKSYHMELRDTALQLFSYAFDGFITSFFTPLISGARVVLADEEALKDVVRLKDIIVKEHVTHFISVPMLYSAILEHLSKAEASGLKVITLAGDRITPGMLALAREKNPALEIAHEYGVTEAAVMSTLHRHQESDEQVTIGGPIANTRLFIRNPAGQMQPIGVAGELCIAGDGVARGYLNRPELTAEKFQKGLYRTGDRARWLNNGTIEFLGRIDHQVKIRGYRIELAEIESNLKRHAGVADALVIDCVATGNEKHLCAYYAPNQGEGEGLDSASLKEFLSSVLPGYMIPDFFVPLAKIPLTAAGKIDRRALPLPGVQSSVEYIAPANVMEESLVSIWSEVLGIDVRGIGAHDNFFDLGGNSIKVMQVAGKVKKVLDREIAAVKMFKYPTVRSFSRFMSRVAAEGAGAASAPVSRDRGKARDRGKHKLKDLKRKSKQTNPKLKN